MFLKVEIDDKIVNKVDADIEKNPYTNEYIIRVKEKDDRIPISNVFTGMTIKFCGKNWVVVEKDENYNSTIVSVDMFDSMPIGKCACYLSSEISSYADCFENECYLTLGCNPFLRQDLDLTALDGTRMKVSTISKAVYPMTFDMYRKWRRYIPTYKDDFWLITPCSYKDKNRSKEMVYVERKTGCIYFNPYHFRHGVVLACKLKANTPVEVVDKG